MADNAPTKKLTPALFPRSFRKTYPEVVHGEGCFLFTRDGKKILDASGGAAVVSIGHGAASVAHAIAAQARSLAYVHSSQFTTRAAAELARRLLALAPPNFHDSADGPGRVLFTSGGSEAAETALKLCRQFFLECNEPLRTKFISRAQSYHGATLGALALSGNVKRRAPFLPLVPEANHIVPCYCYRCPLDLQYPSCAVACADDLENKIRALGAENVAAFFVEPISGATLGAVAPPPEYLPRIAEICRRNHILLVADEVMTGMGRTGKNFAVDHWDVEPDIILVGKGIASGYAPLGAVLVTGRIASAIERGSGAFLHGFTYSAHPVSAAAGLAVLDYIAEKSLFARVAPAGRELLRALEPLRELPIARSIVGDVRGTGLLLGIEFVRPLGQTAKMPEPFDPSANIATRVYDAALRRGVLTYPIQGCADGLRGDHILLAPPFTISSYEISFLANSLLESVTEVSQFISISSGGRQ
ncbi:MAG TPA: aspartate aminotransferase family protein [Candidatus Acidoferrales bacterium]|nr:aspartate aminotransferase family protein [Candidatus Acidoferrales bacterium]